MKRNATAAPESVVLSSASDHLEVDGALWKLARMLSHACCLGELPERFSAEEARWFELILAQALWWAKILPHFGTKMEDLLAPFATWEGKQALIRLVTFVGLSTEEGGFTVEAARPSGRSRVRATRANRSAGDG
jgi:hypothetical protein